MDRRADILALLAQRRAGLTARFGITKMALFGSAARDEMRPDSDVDVLVDFGGPADYDRYFGVKDELEQALGRRVDLVTESGLKPRARTLVERDLIRVA